MAITGWANAQKRKFEDLTIAGTAFAYGTEFVCETIDWNINPGTRNSKELVGGDKKYGYTKSSGAEIVAKVVLTKMAGDDSSDMLISLTETANNRSSTNTFEVREYDDDGNIVLSVTSHADANVIMSYADLSSEAGDVTFNLYIDATKVTVAQS